MISLPFNLLYSTIAPAILLTTAATLLARAREIDLSLDQQCFFVASLQASLYLLLPSWLGAVLGIATSLVVLIVVQSARLYFNRRTGSDGLVTSIASGMVLVGAASFVTWVSGGQRTPSYALNLLPLPVLLVCGTCLFAVWAVDRFYTAAQAVTFPVSPAVGAPPATRSAIIYGVAPAALLTCAAATLLGTYSQSVTPAFTSGLGIIAATIAILAFGRVQLSFLLGLGLALIFVLPDFVLPNGGHVQSYAVPLARLLVVAALPMFVRRP